MGAAHTTGRTRSGADQTKRPLVAIVEDDQDVAGAIEDLLQDANYRTTWYANGADALNRLGGQDEVPSVILLDLRMPEMDGWTFRLEQRARPALSEIPVIAMSADESPQAAAIDADAFVSKPFYPDRLLHVVEEAKLMSDRRKLVAKSMELERLRALGMMVATVAHELSSPLLSITGNLELAARDCARLDLSGAHVLRMIQAAQAGADAITEIVRELRTFSRVESEERTADVVRAIEAAIRLGAHATRTRARIERESEATLPRVQGNEAKLSQVFLNLLVNAAQAMNPGAVSRNRLRIVSKLENNRVVVEVEDTGRGIPPEILPRIFEPFFTTKSPEEGTGIGLSFSREFIESVGGSISVRSVLGVGSTFRVELPIAETQALPEA